MRVFMTSATGQVGEAVADAFLGAGHNVTALARSPTKAEALTRRGIHAVVGELKEPDTYRGPAAEQDVIIHTAFEYDGMGREVPSTDQCAVRALLDVATNSKSVGQFIYTSSAFLLGGISREQIDESEPTHAAHPKSTWRLQVERQVIAAGSDDLRTAVLRLGVVYGGRSFTMNELFSSAEDEGRVVYQVAAENRWPFVYRNDLASLYLLLAEKRGQGIFHGVDGHPLPVAQVAVLASRAAGYGGLTRHVPLDGTNASTHDERVSRDVPVVSTRSRELGWKPLVRSFEEGAAVAWREWREAQNQG